MPGERQKGITYSALLHLLVLVFAIWGLPELFDRDPIEEPAAISVEILPISDISNVKPAEKQAPKKEEDKPKEQAKPSPPVNTSEPPPPPPPAEETKKEAEKKKPEAKKEPPKPKPKKPKEQDLSAVLKAVRETAQKDKDKKNDTSDSGSKSVSNQYDPTLPLTISEKDAIRSQLAKCWVVPAGAMDAHNLIVILRVQVEKTGAVRTVELASVSRSRYRTDNFFRAAADSAVRAVRKCSPLKNLPPEKYSTWRDMELTFDPKEMLY